MRTDASPARVFVLLAGLLGACVQDPPTAVVVHIATDLQIPSEIDGLSIEVSRSSFHFERAYALGAPAEISFPGTLTIAAENDFSLPLTVRLTGTRGARRVVDQTARLPLIPRKVLLLRMSLARACVAPSPPCGDGKTCTTEGCRPIDVDPYTLPEYDSRATYDAGLPADMALDAGVADQGGATADLRPIPDGWVLVPGGAFQMGSPPNEPCREAQGKETLHDVALTLGILVSAYEVTQEEFAQVFKDHSPRHAGCPRCPVENVTWMQAAQYCNALSDREELPPCYECGAESCDVAPEFRAAGLLLCPGYRLPTEAEWEHAYRAGTQTASYNGAVQSCGGADATLDPVAWYSQNASSTKPVGQKASNEWGLYDIAGNVAEWCDDAYVPDLGTLPATNPLGPPTAGIADRVVRGGAWSTDAGALRAAARQAAKPTQAFDWVGFRCVRSVMEVCGNGKVDAGEQCDGERVPSSCSELGYEGGVLACDAACAFVTQACYRCGDGKINGLEQCDGSELGGMDCNKLGFNGGELRCQSCLFDDSGCS